MKTKKFNEMSILIAATTLVVATVAGSTAALAHPYQPRPAPPPGYGPPPFAPAHGRRLETPPPRGRDEDEVQAAAMMAQAISGLGCENAGEALRRLSNQLLGSVRFATDSNFLPPPPHDRRGRMREEMRSRWRRHLRSPAFWQKVWERLADAYRACDLTCFDDGYAVGTISGAGYCAASTGVEGLPGPGFAYQPPLPLCQNAVFVGCQRGYQDAALQYQGCSTYTSGTYDSIFREYQSQDCNMGF